MKYDIEMWDAIAASYALKNRAADLKAVSVPRDDDPPQVQRARVETLYYAEQLERVAHILYVKGS